MRPKHVGKLVRKDGTCQYLVTLQNGTSRWYVGHVPPSVERWLACHTASGDVGVSTQGSLIYHYWQ